MNERIDVKSLLERTALSAVIGQYVSLKPKGIHKVGQCPFHDDKSPSLTVTDNKGLFKCFGCGEGGDAISFLVKMGKTFKEAVAEIESVNGGAGVPLIAPANTPAAKPIIWKPIFPVPSTAPKPDFHHYINGDTSRVWEYRDKNGNLLGYLARYELAGGKKETIPLTFCNHGTRNEWRFQGFGEPRPIYNIKSLYDKPAANVIIVEGEKAADAAQALFPACAVITWQGGTNSIAQVDWSPLHGRKIILWPDNDTAGRLAMFGGWKILKTGKPQEVNGIADLLAGRAQVKTFTLPAGIPEKWDAADAKWTPQQAQKHVKENLIDVPPHGPAPVPAPENPPLPATPTEEKPSGKQPFKFLGFVKDPRSPVHCFFSESSKTVIQCSATGMSGMNLLNLAPLEFWQRTFPQKGKNGFDVNAAANWLVAESLEQGLFDPLRVRGRGAWMDDGRVVLHVGAKLIVDGQIKSFAEHKTRYVYEQGIDLDISLENPLANTEASKLLELVDRINWERPINAYLLAGWCVIAPVCGALPWRPHIWLTGQAGSGKSWVHHSIIKPLLGNIILSCENGTTEPAIRQSLMTDGLPVFLDEAEGEDRSAYERTQSIIMLARSASTDNDTGIMKGGTAGNGPVLYKTRSCFAFSSITPQLKDGNDISRFSILTIVKDPSPDRKMKFEALKKEKLRVLTSDFARRLQARTIKLLPTILKNARVFTEAAIDVIGEQRTGDQLGPLLAGAYSLKSSKEITYNDASDWIRSRDWSEERAKNQQAQESLCWRKIMEHITPVESSHGNLLRSIGELILIAEGQAPLDMSVNPADAKATLIRKGFKIKVHNDGSTWLHVAVRHSLISIILNGTNWVDNYGEIIGRMEGAQRSQGSERFNGINCRTVMLPIETVIGKREQPTSAPVHPGLAEQFGLFSGGHEEII